VFVLSDLDIGMNDWMCPDLKWDDQYRPDRGKVLTREEIDALPKFHRYLDRDDDGIPYRTLPGETAKGAYFTRGSGHNQYGGYTEDSTEYQVVVDRLLRKFNRARTLVPPPVIEGSGEHEIGLVAIGSSHGATHEAMDILRKQGIGVDYMRIRAFPFTREVDAFLTAHQRIFVIEQNRDAQLRALLTLETAVEKSRLHSILHYSGLPMTSKEIVDAVLAQIGDVRRASPALAVAPSLPRLV
jgi:2-oxoglutarate ferredoxin oxidoreductase subunit alpha